MKQLFIVLLMCSMSIDNLSAQNTNRDSNKTTLTDSDKKFITEAIKSGLSEVAMGKFAQNQAHSEQVKEFARMMEQDHNKANQELRKLAEKHNITLPSTLPDANQKKYDEVMKKSGEDFDRAFMKQMIDDHQKAIALFENEAKNGQNEQIRSWARQTLPTLRQHLEQAQQIHNKLQK